ncbi:MAG: hypothetical protein PHH84_01785 [Oscillospiraceae bacterium]|nr:hypothetical protein [Oscillospiraceae bacterium]
MVCRFAFRGGVLTIKGEGYAHYQHCKNRIEKAFFGGEPEFTQDISQNEEAPTNLDIILLKIMLANYQTENIKESM